MEHLGAHGAAGGKSRLLYAHDATVAGSVGGKVTGKAQQVTGGTALVSALTLRYLGRARLTGYLERGRPCFLTCASRHHMFQHGLNLAYHGQATDVLLAWHHLGWELVEHLAVLDHRLDKAGVHHAPIIGYGVVEGEGRYGWHLGLVAYTHPCQRCFTPVNPLPAAVLARHTHNGRTVTRERELQVGRDT